MSYPLIPMCSTPKQASRDGLAGPNASIFLPYYGYVRYFFNGKQYSAPNTLVAQDNKMTLTGLTQVPNYKKDCCNCLSSDGPDMTYVAPA